MTTEQFRKLALSFPETEENPHFERAAFKVTGKRIFATMLEDKSSVNMKLSLNDQAAFASLGKGGAYAVANKWGLQGWTTFEIRKLPQDLLKDAVECAYQEVFKSRSKKK